MEQIKYLKPSLQKRQKRRDKRLRKELVECYRGGMRVKYTKGYKKKVTRNNFEHAKQQEGMKERTGGGTKYFGDNIAPLRRYLASHVGQPWDEVYSKLNQQLDRNSVLGLHVIQHLFMEVALHVELINGKVCYKDDERELVYFGRWPKYYVCPKTKLLKKARQVSRAQWKKYLAAISK